MIMKVNSPFCTLFFSCKVNIYCGSLIPPKEIGITQGSSPPIKHIEFRNNIGTNFAICINFIMRIPQKSSNDTTIMFVLLLYIPILMKTPFTSPKIYLAFEFTTFSRLGVFSRFSPSCLTSQSIIELQVVPMSTIAQVVWPFSLMSINISLLLLTLCCFIFMFSLT